MPAAASIRTLIVDDLQPIRSLVRSSLQRLGFTEFQEAADGDAALRAIQAQPVDLIISDYAMPGLDGLEFLRAVRADPALARTPFIMLSGRADHDLVLQAGRDGVNNYLVKPFTVAKLKAKIEAVIGALS